ncbi:MAG: branched-chain amino acid aminotransferase [Actinomycetia bacterium]|jgi:branched-chain amino acid aminotransferase|nr:branched-chain amino acid aminotransferase [Actinomycetes bacterium]
MTSIELRPSSSPLPAAEREARLADPGFGRYFTDHMVTIRWSAGSGWHDAELVPYGPLELDPAVMVLHYGQAIFEGLKAYRHPDGSVALFRPLENARRFQRSARRLAMPELPEGLFLAAIEALVRQDRAWVPTGVDQSLYLRPFMFATEVGLGVRPSDSYLFLLIASPAGAYFRGGVRPVTVWLSEEFSRAAPGGTGEAKCAGNYAASLVAQAAAAEQGCDQVVWLDAVEHRWVEEMGGMNLYFVQGSGSSARLLTPGLTGTLLPGVTRDSLLQLAADLGYGADESRISVDDWREGNASGEISEVFACGTAAVITPVGVVRSARHEWSVGDGQPGPVTQRLRQALLDIQTGVAPDPHGWVHRLSL